MDQIQEMEDFDDPWVEKGQNNPENFEMWAKMKGSHVSGKIPLVKSWFRFDRDITLHALLKYVSSWPQVFDEETRLKWDSDIVSSKIWECNNFPNLFVCWSRYGGMLGVGGRTFYDRIIIVDDPMHQRAFIFTTLLPNDKIDDFRDDDEWKQDTEGMFTGVAETLISIQMFTYENVDKSGLTVTSYN